ncbi:lysine exporter LysO family protein [Endozoicomonas sp. SESOKO1]|uniref:lysine exporter LysO family protein n=1 Tax=Endozoicomonas sp. SESOKO1 TaxID=2828742 RepID=UPI0021488863|nr:lysine exporter LysO family protein [Endozoicomonas sp. SESOKO1]
MQSLFYSLLPLGVALISGYGTGMVLTNKWSLFAGRLITHLVWILLITIGYEFGIVFNNLSSAVDTLYTSFIFAVLTSIIPFGLISFIFRQDRIKGSGTTRSLAMMLTPIKECLIAIGMVVLGVFLFTLIDYMELYFDPGQLTEYLLYLLIFMVGIDIVSVDFNQAFRRKEIFLVPLLVILGSIIGGILSSLVTKEELSTSLALSSGFGWFTLPGVMVSNKMGPVYGSIALLIDLFRELLAIILLYILGSKHPKECIGVSGATALDSTLPMIKQTCESRNLPLALISGFFLTLLAPFLITFFLEFQG